MKVGLVVLVFAYILTQFYRAILAVLTPSLTSDLGMTGVQLGRASDLWFLGYALMLIPVGWALDRIGPRWTTSVLILLEAAGAALFAGASGPEGVQIGMALNGMGGAPALMAAYFIYARSFPASGFGFFAGIVVALGAVGNVASTMPFAWVVDAVGWRTAMGIMAAVSLVTGLVCAVVIKDPSRLRQEKGGSYLGLLKLRSLWPVYVMVAVSGYPANSLRDLWIGPYAVDLLDFRLDQIAQITLVMGLAMGFGKFAYGALDRFPQHRKAIILGGNLVCVACFLVLAIQPAQGTLAAFALCAGIGFFGASYPLIMSYGKEFLPASALGRGVTLINFCTAFATAVAQFATTRISDAVLNDPAGQRFEAIFLFFALTLLAGMAVFALGHRRSG